MQIKAAVRAQSLAWELLHTTGIAKKIQKTLLTAISLEEVHSFFHSKTYSSIKGICEKYERAGKHIITTNLEHSSIYGPIGYLQKKGFEVSFVKLDENGLVDLDDLVMKFWA